MEFWLISSADVATPPAFAAFAGPNSTPFSWNTCNGLRCGRHIRAFCNCISSRLQQAFSRTLHPARSALRRAVRYRTGSVQMPVQPSVIFAHLGCVATYSLILLALHFLDLLYAGPGQCRPCRKYSRWNRKAQQPCRPAACAFSVA